MFTKTHEQEYLQQHSLYKPETGDYPNVTIQQHSRMDKWRMWYIYSYLYPSISIYLSKEIHQNENNYYLWIVRRGIFHFSSYSCFLNILWRIKLLDFPGGAVVKKPPANAGDTGSSSDPGRSHMPWSNLAHEPQLLSLRATTTEAHAPRAHALQKEKPPQWEAHAPQWRVAPACRN